MDAQREKAILSKVTWRLIPFLFILYVFAYLDRVNVGFAKLDLKTTTNWFTDNVFSIGSGIFFIGYFIFEVPSNIILERVGARKWIARIMISWGILATAMMFINSDFTFYTLRFLLGVAEAGFFPGIILYLTYWYTAKERARMIALFMTATALSNAFGSPLSGFLLTIKAWGLHGWQWLFFLEGVPSVLLGFVVLAFLPDGPKSAKWLTQEEKDWITTRVDEENCQKSVTGHISLWKGLTNPAVLYFSLMYVTIPMSSYGYTFWAPTVIEAIGNLKGKSQQIGLLLFIPFVLAAIVMVLNGRSSDRMQERRWHIAIPSFIGAAGLIGAAYSNNLPMLMVSLTIAAVGMWSILGVFWTLPTSFLAGPAAAGGIALINSIGNLGGYGGSFLFGWLKENTTGKNAANLPEFLRQGGAGDFTASLLMLASIVILGGIMALLSVYVRRDAKPELKVSE